jgi:hypothetical protein
VSWVGACVALLCVLPPLREPTVFNKGNSRQDTKSQGKDTTQLAANFDRQKNGAILNFESFDVQDVCASGIRALQISQLTNKDAD